MGSGENTPTISSAGAKESHNESQTASQPQTERSSITSVRASLFDNPKSNDNKKSMWSKNVPLIPRKTEQRTAEGTLLKRSVKDGNWKSYQYELIGSKLVRFQALGSTTAKRADKYMCIENYRLEKLKCESKSSVWYGFRLTQNERFLELFMRSKEEMQNWFDSLKRHCVLTTFLNDFSTIKLMGKGNFARVYYSRSRLTGAEYAVKAFEKAKFAAVDVDRASLIKEISILRKLNHPGVIKMFDVYENNTHVFLVNELLRGGELMHKLKSHGQFSEQQVCRIVRSLLESLRYLVDKNIMHRDIKPENLILRSKSASDDEIDVVLADFGLADYYDEKGGYMFSRCGTPGYVAPEVLADKLYDFKVDCFSVGVIMFILLTGYSPFKGKSYDEIVIKNYNCEISFDFPSKITDTITPECIDLLKKLLKKDPAQRLGADEALRHAWFYRSADSLSKLPMDISSPVLTQQSKQLQQAPNIQLKTKSPLIYSKYEQSPSEFVSPNTWKKNHYAQRLSSQYSEEHDQTSYSRAGTSNQATLMTIASGESPKINTPGGNQYSQPKEKKRTWSSAIQEEALAIAIAAGSAGNNGAAETKGISRMSLAVSNSSSLQDDTRKQANRASIGGISIKKTSSQYSMAERAKSIREKLEQNLQ